MPKIHSPNKQYTGVSASVSFVNGAGECSDPHLLDWFELHGYTVEHEPAGPPPEKTVDDMNVPELKALAAKMGLALDEKAKKADIVAAIKGAKLSGSAENQDNGEKKDDGAGK